MPKSSTGVGSRILVGLFFCLFMGLGLFFVALIARQSIASLRTWSWKRTSCQIISSDVRTEARSGRPTDNYYFAVQFRYDFGGRSYDSDRYELHAAAFEDYARPAHLSQLYPAGAAAVCYVNPSAPADAVLKRGNLFTPLAVLFPLLFVGIGFAGIYSLWRPRVAASQPPRSISESALHPKGKAVVFFLLIFVVMGLGLFYAFFIRPLLGVASAKSWPAVPCLVLSSSVKSHSGSHGSTTYSVNILYGYEFNGRRFKANRYDFMGGSSSGSARKYAIVARYPPGSRSLCYVNPADPIEAVLERGFTPAMWAGLIPLVFVLFGIGGIVLVGRAYRVNCSPIATAPNRGPAPTRMEAVPRPQNWSASDPLVLKPNVSPWGKLVGALFFALFWNGIVSVFVVNIIKSWRSGPFEWFLALFLVPFVLIGLGIVGAVVYFFLALFNPRPHLTLNPGAVRLGGTLRVGWEIKGRTDALQRLRVRLQGREEATYQNGKNTATDTNVFADIEIADVTVAQAMRSGDGTVTVPGQLMHSFAGWHNKIIWVIRIHGQIARWPDMSEEFPVTILPGTPIREDIDKQPAEPPYERA